MPQFTADVCVAADQAGAAWFVENPASREDGAFFTFRINTRERVLYSVKVVCERKILCCEDITFARC